MAAHIMAESLQPGRPQAVLVREAPSTWSPHLVSPLWPLSFVIEAAVLGNSRDCNGGIIS